MDKDALQNYIVAWHRRNYPNETDVEALIGVEEEIGELNRAELKQAGGIRGTWEYWQEEKKKEVGDVLIGIINFSGHCGISMSKILPVNIPFAPMKDSELALLMVSVAFGKLTEIFMFGFEERRSSIIGFLGFLYHSVETYCDTVGINAEEALAARWTTISKRDFIANPETGGREKESASCEYCVDGTIGETDWTGSVHDRPCSECDGTGKAKKEDATVVLRIHMDEKTGERRLTNRPKITIGPAIEEGDPGSAYAPRKMS